MDSKSTNLIHLLVIDDEPSHFEIVRRIFSSYPNYILHWQRSLSSAKNFLQKFTPDVILCDLKLNDGEGLNLLKFFNGSPPCPVILQSAYSDERAMINAIKGGAVEFIHKQPEQMMRLPFLVSSIYYQWKIQQQQLELQKARQHQLQISKNILENIGIGVLLLDLDLNIQLANPFFYKIFNITEEQLPVSSNLQKSTLPFASLLTEQVRLCTPPLKVQRQILQTNGKEIEVYLEQIQQDGFAQWLILFYDITPHQLRNRVFETNLRMVTYEGKSEDYLKFCEKEIHRSVQFDYFLAILIDPLVGVIKGVPYCSPLAEWLLSKADFIEFLFNSLDIHQPLTFYITDNQSGEDIKQALLVMPIERVEEFNFLIFGRTAPGDWEIENIHLLEYLAHQISNTFQRLKLSEKETQNRLNAEALLKFISLVTQSSDTEQILQQIKNYIMDFVNCSQVKVWIIEQPEFETFPIFYHFGEELSRRLPLKQFPLLERIYNSETGTVVMLEEGTIDRNSLTFVPQAKSYLFLVVPMNEEASKVVTMLAFDKKYNWLKEQETLFSVFANEIAHTIRRLQLFKETQKMAIIDELTGLYNRRGLSWLADREFAVVQRYSHPLLIVFCDVDNFKKFNDKYSYQVGDFVLQTIGKTILSELRFNDFAARYGGDEFVIFLPQTTAEDAYFLINRIDKKISQFEIIPQDPLLRIHLTFGVSQVNSEDEHWSYGVNRAASNMKVNKSVSKNS